MDFDRFYALLPIWCQNLVASAEGWRVKNNRYSTSFWKLLREAENRSHWTTDQVQTYRDNRLRAFIKHCVETVPFYQRESQRIGLTPYDIKSLEDLKNFPIISKERVRENISDFISKSVSKSKQVIIHTSGSTGAGLRFPSTRISLQEQWAVWWRYFRWHGIQPFTWCAYFGGRSVVPVNQKGPPFWRYNYFGRQILFSAYHMNDKNLYYYVEELRRRRPPWIHGYPSLISLLAEYILTENIDLGYEVRWITCGAENLMLHQREMIEKAFKIKARQHYGMVEAVANISECEKGKLHVDEDFSAVEFIYNDNNKSFKIIGTNFSNPATPLIRYDVGDFAALSKDSCSCGRPGRIISSIDGRQEDYVTLKNGIKLGRLDHIFKDMVNIKEAQIYQRYNGEIIIRVVRGEKFTSRDETILLKEARKRIGDETSICIEYLEKIPRTQSGKIRFVISELK